MSTHPTLRRVAYWTGGILAAATAVTVAIHLGPVRKAMGWKPLGVADATGGTNSGWCPFGFGGGGKSDDGVAQVRPRPHNAPDLSKPVAQSRPALGFTLDVTTKAEVLAWADAHDISCKPLQGGSTLECSDVPASLLPAGENTLGLATEWFSFPFDDKLEIVKTIRKGNDPQIAIATLDGQEAALVAKAGAPGSRGGAKDATELGLGALRQASVEFQFQNYRATLRATNMGAKGYVVTELYAAVL